MGKYPKPGEHVGSMEKRCSHTHISCFERNLPMCKKWGAPSGYENFQCFLFVVCSLGQAILSKRNMILPFMSTYASQAGVWGAVAEHEGCMWEARGERHYMVRLTSIEALERNGCNASCPQRCCARCSVSFYRPRPRMERRAKTSHPNPIAPRAVLAEAAEAREQRHVSCAWNLVPGAGAGAGASNRPPPRRRSGGP